MKFTPHSAFVSLPPRDVLCHVVVAIPARNEEAHLWQTLMALQAQRTLDGRALNQRHFEVLLLLNDCSDGSERIAQRFRTAFPDFPLHVALWTFAPHESHVGSARSMLLQEAASRLARPAHTLSASESASNDSVGPTKLLLTTDADTVVDAYWIAENLRSVERGADAVGGDILTRAEDRRDLPRRARLAYVLDRRYRRAVACLEALLDPQPHDPWPRHQHHFGGSMACTLEAYRRSGGMRPVPVLEDVAFYHALLDCGARFRHEPRVRVHTSARMQGRTTIGMSEQLSQWKRRGELMVGSTALVAACFATRALLRRAMDDGPSKRQAIAECAARLRVSTGVLTDAIAASTCVDQCWRALDGEHRLKATMPAEQHMGNMQSELGAVQRMISSFAHSAEEDPCDTSRVAALQAAATMAG